MYFIPICVHTKTVPYKKPRISNKHRVASVLLYFLIKNFCSSNETEQTLRFTTIVNKYIFYIYSYNHHLIPFNNCFRDFLQAPRHKITAVVQRENTNTLRNYTSKFIH